MAMGHPKTSLLPLTRKDETKHETKAGTKDEPVCRTGDELRLHPSFYVAAYLILSCAVILFNKWIFDRAKYRPSITDGKGASTWLNWHLAILLTCYHLTIATIATQILARFSSLLDGRHVVRMTPGLYVRAIVPIGVLYSLSLVCSNQPYLYLSVAFIQMLKGTAPFFVFLALCSLRLASPTLRTTLNLLVIVAGVVLASLGEIKFHMTGFLFQVGGLVFEAYRLAFIQKLLNDDKYKMDPLVSLYYFAPCCAAMIAVMGLAWEWRSIRWEEIEDVGWEIWAANGVVAMGLNVASVLLIGKTSSLVLTLCGVLKSISLIGASMVIWGTVVTPIQYLGNGIAMAGLVYYNLGGDKVRDYSVHAQSWCTRLWQRRSSGGKAMIGAASAVSCLAIIVAVAVGCGVDLDVRGYWSQVAVL